MNSFIRISSCARTIVERLRVRLNTTRKARVREYLI
jgi:hypothetical protein